MNIKIEITADGSHTLYVPELDEHYHSVNGAIQESQHIFIDTGLNHLDKNPIKIIEVGFGTGLNAFLTLVDAENNNRQVDYTAIEAYPVSSEIINSLNYIKQLGYEDYFWSLHNAKWGHSCKQQITDKFNLTKLNIELESFFIKPILDKFDLVYFDAFSPDKQPDMWTNSIFENLIGLLNPGGILVTYCAKGCVRRMLQSVGFTVERLPGPPGKREMLRATKLIS